MPTTLTLRRDKGTALTHDQLDDNFVHFDERVDIQETTALNGFADYNDTSTSSSPVNLVADTWTDIPNDGLGPFSQLQMPNGVTTLLGANGSIDATQLTIYSDILIRQDFTVTPNNNNAALFFRYKLGTGAGEYFLEKSIGRLDQGAGVGYRHSLTTDYIYMGDSNTKDNPIQPQVKLSAGGTLVNAGMAIKVFKR